MMTRLAVIVVVMLAMTTAVCADSFGLIPSMAGKKPKATTRDAAEKAGVPSNIVELGGYTLFGPDADVAAVLTWKKRFGQWKAIDFNAGPLVGLSDSTGNDVIFGGVVEAEASIGGLVLVPRADDGFRLNYGFKLSLVGWSF